MAVSMPFLRNSLVYYPRPGHASARYQREKAQYNESRVPVYLEGHFYRRSVFRPLNAAVGYGLLRILERGERPTFKDVAILRRLPNELPAVAGVITLERQTPLSHVNLRAVQDGVPNAYIGNALDNPQIAALIGKYVRFEVSADGAGSYSIAEATAAQVARHHAARRPRTAQTPARDLSATTYRDLDAIGFADADAFGVKAANLAVLRTLGLADVDVPDGYALPFYFYHEFMRHNGFYADVDALLADAGFRGRHRRRATPRCAACASASPTARCRSGCARRWRPCRGCSRPTRRSAAGRAPTTRTCPASAGRGCTTR